MRTLSAVSTLIARVCLLVLSEGSNHLEKREVGRKGGTASVRAIGRWMDCSSQSQTHDTVLAVMRGIRCSPSAFFQNGHKVEKTWSSLLGIRQSSTCNLLEQIFRVSGVSRCWRR